MAALARLGRGEHPAFDVGPGDLVILSSRVIPGNESEVMQVMGALLRRGVELRSWWSDRAIHVSGHAHREEQRRMIELVRPQAFVPVHGTLHHLTRHAALARELGVPDVLTLENGDIAEIGDGASLGLRKVGTVPSGRIHIFARRALPESVLNERMALAARGSAHVIVPVDARGRLAGEVILSTRGVVDESVDAALLDAARSDARGALDEIAAANADDARPADDTVLGPTPYGARYGVPSVASLVSSP